MVYLREAHELVDVGDYIVGVHWTNSSWVEDDEVFHHARIVVFDPTPDSTARNPNATSCANIEVNGPHMRSRFQGSDPAPATVSTSSTAGDMDLGEAGAFAEAMSLAYSLAAMLDEAYQPDMSRAKAKAEREAEERQERIDRRDEQRRVRRADLAQYYGQDVRVQRSGQRSKASGEMHIPGQFGEDGSPPTGTRWYVRTADAGMWDFSPINISCFEVKDGNRFREVPLNTIEGV